VEANARRGGLVRRAEDWRWSSLWVRGNRQGALAGLLATWPVAMPRDWLERVNEAQDEKELGDAAAVAGPRAAVRGRGVVEQHGAEIGDRELIAGGGSAQEGGRKN